jgi:hypothetical protein
MAPKMAHDDERFPKICPNCSKKVHHCKYCDRYFMQQYNRDIHQHTHTCKRTINRPGQKRGRAVILTHICLDCLETFPDKGAKDAVLKHMSLAISNLDRLYFTSGQRSSTGHSCCNTSQIQDAEKDETYMMASSLQETRVEVTDTSNSHPEEHIPSSKFVESGSSLSTEFKRCNATKNCTTRLTSSPCNTELQGVLQAMDVFKEENKSLKDQLKYYEDANDQLMMPIKEPTKIEEDSTDTEIRHQKELTDSIINTLFKVTAQQEVEIVRQTQGSKALQEQLEKLAESNGSLVKHNIALRRQVRDLKTPTFIPLPLSSSLARIPMDASPATPQAPDTAETDRREIRPPREKDVLSPQLSLPLPHTANTSRLAKFKEKVGKLLGYGKSETVRPSESPLSHGDRDKESYERRSMSGNPWKLTKKRNVI